MTGTARRLARRTAPAVLGLAVAAALATAGPAAAQTLPEPPPPVGTPAGIHPGVMTRTDGAQCTANFVFRDAGGTYIGQAAHCSGTGASTDTNGCTAGSLPLGTPVTVGGASRPGTMVYNSWLAMQAAGETDPDACAYNDLALVRIDPADAGTVSPDVPFVGGPTGLDTDGTAPGDRVYSSGNSSLRGGVALLSPKTGASLGDTGNGWSHTVYTATPGIPGDSGSAFLSADGTALGVLSTVALVPLPASNGVGDLGKELAYARAHGRSGLTLVTGGAFHAVA